MKKISKDEKVFILERFLRAILGRPEAELEYRKYGDNHFEIWAECDINDIIKNMTNLEIQDISASFFVEGYMEKYPWDKKKRLEGRAIAQLMFEPLYWEQIEKLKKELKTLREKKEK